ncbi:hypothetical protein [uncultured Roseobacter sp.]|uniref:hypothetical protein n=1 Tax=uncultured Roseobacter sp. TaxID=114847 RepID=UPI00263276F6|nr:hypothetical protein [uncultured Roseobacter sp.]
MAYSEILRLSLRHAYFGADVPPVMVQPGDARAFERAGCLLRQRGAVSHVLVDDDETRPEAVALTLVAGTQDMFAVTKGAAWGAQRQITAPLDQDEIAFAAGETPETEPFSGRFVPEMATLEIALPEAGRRDLVLSFEAVASHWAYHLIGVPEAEGLTVIDTAGVVAFEDLGTQDLPNGQAARVIRSAQTVAARARPVERFALQKAGAFGPETLVSVLPAGAPPFKPIPDAGAEGRLQSDIFVTLW